MGIKAQLYPIDCWSRDCPSLILNTINYGDLHQYKHVRFPRRFVEAVIRNFQRVPKVDEEKSIIPERVNPIGSVSTTGIFEKSTDSK